MSRTVIIGGGVVGLSCAYALMKRGEQITLLDERRPGTGCSAGNAGWITPSLAEPVPAPGLTWTSLKWMMSRDSPLHIDPMAAPQLAPWLWSFWRHCNAVDFREGRKAWALLTAGLLESFDALAADGVSFEMHSQGLLFVFLREATMRAVMDDAGLSERTGAETPQVFIGAELRRFEPVLSDRVQAGFWIPEERHVRPESLCDGLLRYLTDNGAEVRVGPTVTGGVAEGAALRAVKTTEGQVSGDRFLIAAGARSGIVSAAIAGVSLPVQAGKGYSITVTTERSLMRRPLYLDEAKLGCSPFHGGYRFAGTMELSGLNERLVPARVRAIRRSAERYLSLSEDSTQGVEWVGMRPLAPDGVPLMGRLPGRSNVYIATGHGMLGVTCALTTATLMADLIEKGRTSVDLSPLDPARFVRT